MPNSQGNVKFKFGSLTEYNSLSTKDPDTWYIITDPDAERIYIGSQLFVNKSAAYIWEAGSVANTAVQTVASGNKGTATAAGAVSIGKENSANGSYSVAQGRTTTTESSGTYSHSEGLSTTAIGSGSHAEGQLSKATGTASHAEGFNTDAYNNYMTAVGMLNAAGDSDTLFVVGTGYIKNNASYRRNGLKVNSGDSAASSAGMNGSVAVNKFSCNAVLVVDIPMIFVMFKVVGQYSIVTFNPTTYYVTIGSSDASFSLYSLVVPKSYLTNMEILKQSSSEASTIWVNGIETSLTFTQSSGVHHSFTDIFTQYPNATLIEVKTDSLST